MLKRILLILLAVLVIIAAVWYIRVRTKPVLDDEARAQAPGSFVQLSDGYTHYEDSGDTTAPAILLIHGSSAPYVIWDRNFGELVYAGYRVVRYDLFGRGYSDRPRVDYGRELYVRQAAELVDALGIDSFHLVGLSMGGALAVSLADSFPDRVTSMILISPAGPYLTEIKLKDNLDNMKRRIAALFSAEGTETASQRDVLEPLMPAIRNQFKYRGTEWASYSFLKNRNPSRLKSSYERVGKHPRPGLLIWGKDDTILLFEHSKEVLKYLPHLELHEIEGAGHVSHFEKPEVVNPIILEFLDSSRHILHGDREDRFASRVDVDFTAPCVARSSDRQRWQTG